ncbi:MAG: O-antigen ligase family protein [Pseudomonadota bacterium]
MSIAALLASALALALDGDRPSARQAAVPRSILLLIGAFLLACLASVITSKNSALSAQAAAMLVPAALVGALLFELQRRAGDELQKMLLIALNVLSLLTSVLIIRASILYPELAPDERLETIGSLALIVPNDLSLLVILLPFTLLGLKTSRSLTIKAVLVASLLTTMVGIGMSGSRLCVLMAFFMLLLAARDISGAFRVIPHSAFALALTFTALDLYQGGLLLPKFLNALTDNGRFAVWYAGSESWWQRPWLGVGQGQFEAVYQSEVARNAIPSWLTIDGRFVTWAHSLFIEALVERGVVGLLLLSAVLLAILKTLRPTAVGELRPESAAVWQSYCLFLIAGALELTLQRNWVPVLLALYIAIALSQPYARRSIDSVSKGHRQ